MVVAARAGRASAEECLRRGGEHVVELIEAIGGRIRRLVVPGSEPMISGGDQRLGSRLLNLVTGQLLHDEPVERLVPIETPDHVVAKFPDHRLVPVALIPV